MSPLGGSFEGTGVLEISAFGISNISIRGKTDAGSGGLIHGINFSSPIVLHDDPIDDFYHYPTGTRILASAKGAPTLSQFGITDGVMNPSSKLLEYHQYSQSWETIAENDDWDASVLPRVLGFERPKGIRSQFFHHGLKEVENTRFF